MNTWFECKVRYTKIDEKTGKEKKVNEPYLVDAISFSEAEERIYMEMEAYISGEFTVTDIRRANFTDIFPNEIGQQWYKAKVTFMSIDLSAGKEKKVTNNMLILGDDVDSASKNLKEALEGMTIDYEVTSISESPIIDYFPYLLGSVPGEKGAALKAKHQTMVEQEEPEE